jgi:hypothetical protein
LSEVSAARSPDQGKLDADARPYYQEHSGGALKGTAAKYGLHLLRLDSKSRVFERVRWPDDQPDAWHLPHDVDEDYCRQIVSEAHVRLASGHTKWVPRSKENHYLDCDVMQAAAAHLLNVVRIGEGARNAPSVAAPPGALHCNGVSASTMMK